MKHVRGLFKAEGFNNSAEPGNSMHSRFYVSETTAVVYTVYTCHATPLAVISYTCTVVAFIMCQLLHMLGMPPPVSSVSCSCGATAVSTI